jgi:hypothetical protein
MLNRRPDLLDILDAQLWEWVKAMLRELRAMRRMVRKAWGWEALALTVGMLAFVAAGGGQ